MQSDTDYLLRELTLSPVYRAPLDEESDAWLESRWHALGGDNIIHGSRHRDGRIELEARTIAPRPRGKGRASFDFASLCQGPRGASCCNKHARRFHPMPPGKCQ